MSGYLKNNSSYASYPFFQNSLDFLRWHTNQRSPPSLLTENRPVWSSFSRREFSAEFSEGSVKHLHFLLSTGPDAEKNSLPFVLSLFLKFLFMAWHASIEKNRIGVQIQSISLCWIFTSRKKCQHKSLTGRFGNFVQKSNSSGCKS